MSQVQDFDSAFYGHHLNADGGHAGHCVHCVQINCTGTCRSFSRPGRCVHGDNPPVSKEEAPMTDRCVMATTAVHKLGDISRDRPDLAWITGEDGDDWIGAWVEGYGFANVRFPKAATRELTEVEKAHYRGKLLGVGSAANPILIDGNQSVNPAREK